MKAPRYSVKVNGDLRWQNLSYHDAHRYAEMAIGTPREVEVIQHSHRVGIEPCVCCRVKDGELIEVL